MPLNISNSINPINKPGYMYHTKRLRGMNSNMNFSLTCLWTKLHQKRICALLYGSSGRNRGPFFQVSSIYSRMMSDSISGFPLRKSIGTFLWIGLYSSSTELLFFKSSSTFHEASLCFPPPSLSLCDIEIQIAMQYYMEIQIVTFSKPALINFLRKNE